MQLDAALLALGARPAKNEADLEVGDREIARATFRAGLFRRRGMSDADAQAAIDRLMVRDFTRDSRRMCCECQHMQRNQGCFPASQGRMVKTDGVGRWFKVIPNMLQRCSFFEFQTP